MLMTGKAFKHFYQAFHTIVSDADGETDPALLGIDLKLPFLRCLNIMRTRIPVDATFVLSN